MATSRLFTPSDFARHEGSDRPLEIGLYTVKKGGLVVVASVEDNSPAAKAGLRRGDVVQAVNGSSCAIEETLSVLQGLEAGVENPAWGPKFGNGCASCSCRVRESARIHGNLGHTLHFLR
ncbi:PDZ domain-containing protein [Meiothermus sp.]|uniref:PDZ domain-containing protein n=1 Tax=Meiothermus sp. TaxID=1955249 RepID=UPI00399EFC22